MKRSLSVIAIVAFAALQPARAEPTSSTNTTYYSISGTTAAELKSQMRSNGPQGYWAYTRWSVQWTGDCRVSLMVSYTYPQWTNQASAPAALRSEWSQMISRLRTHEEGHAQNGRNAAREIEQSRCRDPRPIIDKWAAQDKTYDAQTDHGRGQGVVLP